LKPAANNILDGRLNAHFLTVGAASKEGARQRRTGDWRLYAAVTGSALAMVSSASASTIHSVGPVSFGNFSAATTGTGNGRGTLAVAIGLNTIGGGPAHTGFSMGVSQILANGKSAGGGTGVGAPFLRNSGLMGFLFTATHDRAAKLASGVTISAHSPFATPIWEGATVKLATSCAGRGCASNPSHNGLAPNMPGFAGFMFETAGHGVDYGWIELEYTLGANGLATGGTVEAWAYDNAGNPIVTGDQAPTAPEPSTMAMALLAAGAAGVVALRKRRSVAR